MRITDIIWKEAIVEKLVDKHGLSIEEVGFIRSMRRLCCVG